MVLGDRMHVLRQRTVSDETGPFLYANHMPGAIDVFPRLTVIWPWTGVKKPWRHMGETNV